MRSRHDATRAHPWIPQAAAVVALVAAQIALSTHLLDSATNYDEGVYLAALDALRHGQTLGSQVFAAQLPGFYDLLRAVAAVAGASVTHVRAGLLAVFALGTVGAWLIGRHYGGGKGGALTAALFVIAPPLDLFAPQVIADAPALAISIFAVGLATIASVPAAVAAGVMLSLAVSVKLTAITAIPALAWFARRRLIAVVSGAAAAAIVLLALHASALGDLWTSGITYHEDARKTPDVIPHPLRQIYEQMPLRTPFVWLAVAAAVVGVVWALRRVSPPLGVWPLWLWLALGWAFLLLHQPLHYNHLILVPGILAVAAGGTLAAAVRGRTMIYAAVFVLVVLGYVQQWRRVDTAWTPEPQSNVAAANALERLVPSSSLVVDDRPIISFLARRQVVGQLVDLAELRFETGSLTQSKVIEESRPARAIVVSRSLRDKERVTAYLRRQFRLRYSAGGVEIWTRR